jgi:hypothetical protein
VRVALLMLSLSPRNDRTIDPGMTASTKASRSTHVWWSTPIECCPIFAGGRSDSESKTEQPALLSPDEGRHSETLALVCSNRPLSSLPEGGWH